MKYTFLPPLCMMLTSNPPNAFLLTKHLALFVLLLLTAVMSSLHYRAAKISCCFSMVIRPKVVPVFQH